MNKGMVLFLMLIIFLPLAFSISIKELLSRYSFFAVTPQMNVTNYSDFMVDNNKNYINDTLVFELTTNNAAGTFIFAINLFDKDGILTNETTKTLNAGTNNISITFASILLTQNQFNYSIKIYNSTYSLKYRKDSIPTQNYSGYEEGFKAVEARDLKSDKTLKINITLNSSINGAFESTLFLNYNKSTIFSRQNISIINSTQYLIFSFDNETLKGTHHAGTFNVSSLKIDKKILKLAFQTAFYDFKEFAVSSYISNLTDTGVDTNGNNKYNLLQINANVQIAEDNNYAVILALYDLFDNVIETKNISSFLKLGNNTISFDINGSKIYDKKLNGPYAVKYIKLFEDGILKDQINDAYITKNYNFNDFDNPNLPDLNVNISISDGHHYGVSNITINFTFRNAGNKHAFNVFTDIFDNKTFSRSNKSIFLNADSRITSQVNFTNISDFEISAIADLQDFVEESNESNNAERFVIKLNRRPNLTLVKNITVNETNKIKINLSASDPNGDNLSFSINLSKFSSNHSIFEWITTTIDSGNYTLSAIVSDGYLSDLVVFRIIVLDVPEIDADNDGINDSIDRLIGDEKSVNTSTINLKIFLDDSSNISQLFNESRKVRLKDNNLTIAEFDFDFSLYKLNLTNLTINKQTGNATGSLVVRGLALPEGKTKTLYLDKLDSSLNGICIKEAEISSISEISGNCGASNEFKIECDGTLQQSYTCIYNSTLSKYKVQGLRHSGMIQFAYTKPSSESSSTPAPSGSGSGSGGGGGVTCISNWQCSEWSQCINDIKNRECHDINQCAFASNKPAELQECVSSETKESPVGLIKIPKQENKIINKLKESSSSKFTDVTSHAIKLVPRIRTFSDVADIFAVMFVLAACYLAMKSIFPKNL